MSRARRLGFAAVAGLYLLACAVTIGGIRHPLRPLFEGIGPAPPYRWVNPPHQFKATNVAPIASSQTIQLTGSGSPQTGAVSIDGQLVLALASGTIPPSDGHTSVSLAISPHDPAHLGPVPAGLYPDGNAYQVTATYLPGSQVITAVAHPIDAIVETPAPAKTVLLSPDGRTWEPIPTHHIPGRAAVATTFSELGYVMAATNVQINPTTGAGGSGALTYLLPIVLALVVLIPVTAAFIWRRVNRGRR